jgi:filamentous hemagglutinin family protein
MNKHCFRLIFSKTFGFLIPVAEISTAKRKPGQTQGPSTGAKPNADQPTGWALKALPLALVALLPNAFADIVVAPNQTTSVTQSANNVPVVEIANPNNQGLSHNRFTEFNVNRPGVIFNNSLRDGVSQIGEQVMHNGNLTREAKAILTEVTGNGPSNLSGTLEVFGGRADLLFAKGDHTMTGAKIVGNAVDVTVGGKQTITSMQDISTMDHVRGSWGVSAGVAWDFAQLAAGNPIPKPTGSVSASGGKDYDNSAITKQQSGIDGGTLNLAVAKDQSLTGAHIINRSGKGSFTVGGETIATSLTDTRDKDGGYAGASGGINRNGITQITVQGGRVDQVRYEAQNNATVDLNGGKATLGKGVNGTLNNDDTALVNVNKDYTIQGTDIKVEIAPGAFKKGKGKGDDGDAPEAPRQGSDTIDAPERRPSTQTIDDGPTITRPSGDTPAPDYDGSRPGTPQPSRPSTPRPDYSDAGGIDTPDRTTITPPRPNADLNTPKPSSPGTSDVADGPTTTRPPKPMPSDTPDRTSVTNPNADGATDTKPAKPTTGGVDDGPTVTKPSKPVVSNADDGEVTMRPKPDQDPGIELTNEIGNNSLRNVLDRVSNVDQNKIAQLKDKPIVLNLMNADGTRSRVVISSAADYEALNGRQIIFKKGNASDPRDLPQYIQVNKASDGTYGFDYKSSRSAIKPVEPGTGMERPTSGTSDPDAPAVVKPPRFSNIVTEVDAPPTPPKASKPVTGSGSKYQIPEDAPMDETRF